jgi:hypothetical protein
MSEDSLINEEDRINQQHSPTTEINSKNNNHKKSSINGKLIKIKSIHN